jgi:hypothetical protein
MQRARQAVKHAADCVQDTGIWQWVWTGENVRKINLKGKGYCKKEKVQQSNSRLQQSFDYNLHVSVYT